MDILEPDCIIAPLVSSEKQDVINELIDRLGDQGRVGDLDSLKDAVWSREQTRTTGIGHGLAIPHGKCSSLKQQALAIGKPAEPIDFEAIDTQPVRLVVLLASPPDKTKDHIEALAHISRMMNDSAFREEIYSAETALEIYELISKRVS
ncbi:MAG: PTS sugar transporter subunit IIA [Phycisphaerales bacterium]|nr:PTS sugar transporter subunit IIA [Phycisphaerales bacterium]